MNLRKQLQEALKRIAKLEKENAKLREWCENLEKRLKAYENPHTPSSKRAIKEKPEPETPKKKGAPPGHVGVTRNTPPPTEVVVLEPSGCPRCESRSVRMLKEHKKIVEDVQVTKIVREFHWYDCVCERCGKKFATGSSELPKKGRFGPNISSLWMMLHYIGTVPFDRLAKISENCFGVDITPAGIHNVIYRTADVFESRFNRIRNRIANSKYVGSDETTYSFNGKKYWLWNLSTKKDVLVLMRNSRGAKVLEEIFGDFLDGVLNSDCLRTYDRFKAREYQKCWAHVLRDAKDLAKHNKEGDELYEMLSRMYKHITEFKADQRENTRESRLWVKEQKNKILSWLDRRLESKAVLNLVLRLAKHLDGWFTCLKYPYVEPTNNATERDIRKEVVARKVSGLHRSDLGLHSREIMMSVILTLQKSGVNPFKFVQNSIERHNLGLRVS